MYHTATKQKPTATIAYFDCFHGAAGDMLLASLLDAGLDLTDLRRVLALLPLTGYTLEHRRTISHQVSGSTVQVQVHTPQPARSWADIRPMLEDSPLPERTRTRALGAFERLARAEAAVHGTDIERVHFHEVGGVDSIVDVVGVCAGLDLLGVEQVYASPLPLGSGWVETQHGPLPVPAPATLSLLAEAGAPIVPAASTGELLTPTAAALLAELAHFEQPPMHLHRAGYGFGHRSFDRLNGLRVWLGEPGCRHHHDHHDHHHDHHHEHHHDQPPAPPPSACSAPERESVVEVRCNLDDTTGEIAAYTIEQLLAAGALDAWAVPLVMKKGRPAIQLACLAHPHHIAVLAALILRETPTLGVRWEPMERLVAHRRTVQVPTPWGPVRLKQKILSGTVVTSAPEYEDCAALARTHGVPLSHIYTAALQSGTTSLEPV
ncbi:MAG: nickel pincer cofactor biosynthesis protein LarC [Chloroflexaceae bacterium]|nr:nickel pincer cofactor biosynthesis protein LarC [Chloroflexaceae bacterium]